MMFYCKNKSGYSLVEVLIVFTIILLVVTITSISFAPLYKHIQISRFFNQLQLDVSYAQIYALNNFRDVHIVFYPENHRYKISSGQLEPNLIERDYSNKIDIELLTLSSTVTFLANGTIKKAGKMYVRYDEDIYSFVFLFGKGQTYVEKL